MQFCAKIIEHEKKSMLNICDAELIGKNISQNELTVVISKIYYGDQIIEKDEAKKLLQNSLIINMAGKNIVSLSLELGVGSENGVKKISGVPFLIIFKI